MNTVNHEHFYKLILGTTKNCYNLVPINLSENY